MKTAISLKSGVLTGAVFVAGCTHLDVAHVEHPGKVPLAGAPYNLSYTQYKVEVVRRITSCASPEIAVAVTLSAKEAPDPRHAYVIDLASLRSFFKTTSLTVDYYDNGTLKAVNAKSTDVTASVLGSVFKTIGKIAGLGTALFAGQPPGCESSIAGAFALAKTKEGEVKSGTHKLEVATTDLQALVTMAAAMGDAWGKKDRERMGKQIEAVEKARKALEKTNAELKETLAKITVTDSADWPPDGETFSMNQPLFPALTKEQLDKWFDNLAADSASKLAGDTAVWVRIDGTSPLSRESPCEPGKCLEDKMAGLKYRMPARGRMRACSDETCSTGHVLATAEGPITQLGHVFTLPLDNYPFMNQSINATFNEAGQPTQIGVTSETNAVEAANSFDVLVDEVVKFREASKPKSELAQLKEETELLKAKAELEAAKKALQPITPEAEQIAALTANTAVLEAELANLKAQATLAEAKGKATN